MTDWTNEALIDNATVIIYRFFQSIVTPAIACRMLFVCNDQYLCKTFPLWCRTNGLSNGTNFDPQINHSPQIEGLVSTCKYLHCKVWLNGES